MMNGLKIEDRLEGASNFTSWKFRVMLALEENELVEFVEGKVPEPSDENEKPHWKKKGTRAKKILVDLVKDHLVPIIYKLKIAREMFKTLEEMYEFNNTSKALALKKQLHHVKMAKGDSVMPFFMKISELRDQLSTIGHMVDDKDLAMLALNGLPKSWEPYIQGISVRSKLPKFDCLRADCIQEESRLAARGNGQSSTNEEIHVPKDKRTNLEPSGKKGIFVGYSESSKAYRIYIPGQKLIEINWDVTFEEDVSFKRSKGSHMEIDNEDQ